MQLDPSLSLQTSLSAIDDLSNANKYIEEILKHICIDSLGVLVDEERKNIIFEPYRVCRRVNILRDYPDDKIKIYP